MKTIALLLVSSVIFALHTAAQISISSDNRPPDPSAGLDVTSNSKAALLPRMTQAQMTSIPNPANSLAVFCTTDKKIYSYVAGENAWKEIQYGATIPLPAKYIIGFSDSCAGFYQTKACYYAGDSLHPFNRIEFLVTVSVPGYYIIYTDTINGYSFYGTGIWEEPGLKNVALTGHGTPIAASVDQFTAKQSDSIWTCTFSIQVLAIVGCYEMGIIVDPRDGKSYQTVQIGDQCWLRQNMNIGTRINSEQDQQNNGTIEKYCYMDQESNCDIYGGLYQWDEVMQYVNVAGTQGICPPGWHVPDVMEGQDLFICLGIENPDFTKFYAHQNNAGGKLKETGLSHWATPNKGASNVSGFTALGSGYITPGTRSSTEYSRHINNQAAFWISETCIPYWIGPNPPGPENYGIFIGLSYNEEGASAFTYGRYHAHALRCLRN